MEAESLRGRYFRAATEWEKKDTVSGIIMSMRIIRLNYGGGYGLYTESEEGAGTCIYMTLPVRKGEKDV